MEEVLQTAIEDALTTLGIEPIAFSLSHPENLQYGDYACNVAMVVAPKVGKSPREIAAQIKAELDGQIEYVEKIEIAGPGFLNFYFARDFFVQETVRIEKLGENWGRNHRMEGKKVIVEYTDPNPFKEFHIGHMFTNSVGESIARLFMMSGALTKRVNYQGDVGLHVANAIYGMQQLSINPDSDFTAQDLGKAYAFGATAYKEDVAAQEAIRAINKKVYNRENALVNNLYDAGRKASLAYFETLYAILDTQFDAYFFESEVAPYGKELVLSHPEVFKDSDGAKVFVGEDYGLHTRVFLNSEGLPTYEAKELALAKRKEDVLGAYDLSVISTSNEITEYFKVLKKAMSFVYPNLALKTEHIGHGTVRLTTGKMSSRTGDVIGALSFINEVAAMAEAKIKEGAPDKEVDHLLAQDIAIGAIKYATLKSNILQDSTFDKEQALSFEGNSGPYLMYTHARISSALAKASSLGIEGSVTRVPETPYVLERILYRFEAVVEKAMENREPHHVAVYLTELAGAFNSFYAVEKIADVHDEFAPYKVALSKTVAKTLKNGLWVLGIKAPTVM